MNQKKRRILFMTLMMMWVIVSILLIISRNHFLLGTVLNLSRWILMPLGLIIVLVMMKGGRKKIAFLFILILSLLFGEWTYTRIQYYSTRKKIDDHYVLDILNYNLLFLKQSPEKTLKMIRDKDPDIILLQELTPDWTGKLASSLDKTYPYQFLVPMEGTHGTGIYSKFPLREKKIFNNKSKLPVAQYAEIQLDETRLGIGNVHLASPAIIFHHPEKSLQLFRKNYEQRREQYFRILEYMNKRQTHTDGQILAGDFNTMPSEPLYRDIRMEWSDLFMRWGQGKRKTFPNSRKFPFPLTTLDYLFIRGEISGISSQVIREGYSDHFAIYAKVKI